MGRKRLQKTKLVTSFFLHWLLLHLNYYKNVFKLLFYCSPVLKSAESDKNLEIFVMPPLHQTMSPCIYDISLKADTHTNATMCFYLEGYITFYVFVYKICLFGKNIEFVNNVFDFLKYRHLYLYKLFFFTRSSESIG